MSELKFMNIGFPLEHTEYLEAHGFKVATKVKQLLKEFIESEEKKDEKEA